MTMMSDYDFLEFGGRKSYYYYCCCGGEGLAVAYAVLCYAMLDWGCSSRWRWKWRLQVEVG